ncbi:sulfotransferase 6B1-like isoform X1 [Dendrobates tinctorius]|uniref:sulfotransferase 6B1-like isoform X1 n=1 Tax=Dendrobates tinctorius TaxID=92724 RepID=UPI003CC93FA2
MAESKEDSKSAREKFLAEMKRTVEKAKSMTPEELQVSYKGILYPSLLCSEATFQAMETLEAREDDVLIMTYPKCGTNWSIEILHQMLYEQQNKEPTIDNAMLEFGKPEKFEMRWAISPKKLNMRNGCLEPKLTFMGKKIVSNQFLIFLKHQPSPRLFASHLTYENIPKSFLEKTKILLILRNPKDTAVSYYHFLNGNPVLPTMSSWDSFFDDFITGNVIYGSYFDYTLGWEKHLDDGNLLVLTFEDMKTDLLAELKKISEFYGITLTDEQLQKVHDKSTFKSMKGNAGETHGNMANVFFRKGEIGDWKSLFTEEQSKQVDAKFEEYLAGTKLGAKINYSKYCTF